MRFAENELRFQLLDRYQRVIKSLRISLTQRCNFNCFFCHREGESNPKGVTSAEEIEALVSVASDLGIRQFKLTGGEPLLREDVIEVVHRISSYADEVSMTTNGVLLEENAPYLKEAGLRRVNISLHSMNPQTFTKITGCNVFSKVKKGIVAAIKNDLKPAKLNMVVLNGVNTHEIPNMIEFSKDVGAVLQLIEFQPLQKGAGNWNRFYFNLSNIERMLKKQSFEVKERDLHRRRQYHLEDGGVVEVVRPMHNSQFCRFCSRLRMTSDGRLKPCLMREDNLVDCVSILRDGASQSELTEVFMKAVALREPYWRE